MKTISENEAGSSKLHLKNVKLLYNKVGNTYQKNFKNLIKSSLMNIWPVTLEDFNKSKKVYGPNISALKGKTTLRKTDAVVKYYRTVPREIMDAKKNITISGDILFFNEIHFLITIRHRNKVHQNWVHQKQEYESACWFNGEHQVNIFQEGIWN